MNLSEQLDIVVAETAFLATDQCRVCERQGLPILPLRHALVPGFGTEPVEPRLGLRTLRQGYLYVLLDRKIWQAYEVTPEGYLRQFNPYAPPPAPARPLAEHCIYADHDVPASFLNIDTSRYSVAWLAFASDPWPSSVLNGYKAGKASRRFQQLNLATARDNPASVGIAMSDGKLQVDQQVYEYQQSQPSGFHSVHGFHSRLHRQHAVRGFLRNAIPQHALPQGVLALAVDDTLGLVQEYNGLRTRWVHKRQQWQEDPLRAYQHQTSQCLLAIRALHRTWAEQRTGAMIEPLTGDGPPVFVDPQRERQRLVEAHTRDSHHALEERYDEGARAAFQSNYDWQLSGYQEQIDQAAEGYASACRSRQFDDIDHYDYDGDDPESAWAYSATMALCLRGGISEVLNPESPASGPSARLWQDWLNNLLSPIYRALLLRDQHLLEALLPSFNITGDIDWDDSEKLYSLVSKAIASDEAEHLIRAPLREAMAQLLGALNAASASLQPLLGPGIERVVSRLNSVSQLLHNRLHVVELRVQMVLSEYYALQSAHLRTLQRKAAEAAELSWESINNSLGRVDHEARRVYRDVQPMIQGGLLSLAVLDPRLANRVITVSVWVEGKAAEVQQRLLREISHGKDQLGNSPHTALLNVAVGLGTLDPQARRLLHGVQVTSQQVATLVRTSFTGLRGVTGSGELLLALGGLYLLSDSMKKNLAEVDRVLGDKSTQARMALYGSSLAMVGGGVEIVGLALRESAKQVQGTHALSSAGVARVNATLDAGKGMARAGAVIGATSGLYDAVQAGMAASRSLSAGDTPASIGHSFSGAFYAASAGLGIWAVLGTSALYGPLGWSIVAGLSGYAFYKWAEGKESTPLERWARRCYFGHGDENPLVHWNTPDQAHIAIAELNAVTIGVEVDIEFRLKMLDRASSGADRSFGSMGPPAYEQRLVFRLALPRFDPGRSAYRWTLTVHRRGDGPSGRYNGGEVVAQGNLNPPSVNTAASALHAEMAAPKLPKKPDFKSESTAPTVSTRTVSMIDGGTLLVQEISGSIELLPDIRRHSIEAATLSVTYWPDHDSPNAYAELTAMGIN